MMPHIQPPPDTSSLPFVGTCATKAKLRHFDACIPWTDDTLLMRDRKPTNAQTEMPIASVVIPTRNRSHG